MKMTIERLLAIVLVLALALTMFACDKFGNDSNGDQNTDQNGTQNNVNPEDIPDYKYLGTTGVLPDTPPPVDCAETNGEIKNIILIIGDGMGEAQLDAAELIYGKEYAFRDEFQKFYSDTNSLNTKTNEATEVTDSAASATAMATGYLTYNKYTGVDTDILKLLTILDVARMEGKATGFVTTDYLTGATPAGFTAHTLNRNLEHEVIKSQIHSGVDLLVGQHYDKYEDYAEKIKEKYNYFDKYDKNAILAKANEDTLLHCEIETEAEGAVTLSELSGFAIEYLCADKDGFVLVIEQAHIDKNCHDMDLAGSSAAAESLNATVEAVMQFARNSQNTAVIVTADHETRGLVVSEDSTEYNKTIATKNGGEISYDFTSTYHTDTLVPVYTWGFVAHPEKCKTFTSAEKIKNTDIYHFVADLIENS